MPTYSSFGSIALRAATLGSINKRGFAGFLAFSRSSLIARLAVRMRHNLLWYEFVTLLLIYVIANFTRHSLMGLKLLSMWVNAIKAQRLIGMTWNLRRPRAKAWAQWALAADSRLDDDNDRLDELPKCAFHPATLRCRKHWAMHRVP